MDAAYHRRTTLQIAPRRRLIVLGMVVLAIIMLVFLTISYNVIFIIFNILSIFIFCSYLVMWLEGASEEKPPPVPEKWPHVTIIIPSYNTKATIFRCIGHCKRQDYPGRLDIMVVEDGSTDGSAQLLAKTGGITVVKNPHNMGKAAALNAGIREAKGEIVVCVDSDSYPRKDMLRKAVCHFYEDEKVASVVVFVRVDGPKNLLQRIQEIEYWISFGFFFRTIASIDGLYVTPGPTAMYRRDVLLKLGGFDEQNLTEDMEIALRMQKNGWKIRACHESEVATDVPDTLYKLFRQRVRWYRGGVMNIIKYIELFFNRKYGDFGLFVLPTTLGSGFFAALFMAWSLLVVSKNSLSWLLPMLYSISGGATSFLWSVGNGLVLFQSAWLLGLFSLAIWMFFLVKSFEIAREKFSFRHLVPLVCLLWIYPLFIGIVFMLAYAQELSGSGYKW